MIERGGTRFLISHRKKMEELKCIVDARDINIRTNIERCKMSCFYEIFSMFGKGRWATIRSLENMWDHWSILLRNWRIRFGDFTITLCKVMKLVLGPLYFTNVFAFYGDVSLVPGTEEERLSLLKDFFESMWEANLAISPDKLQFIKIDIKSIVPGL